VLQVTVSGSGEFQIQLKSFVNDRRVTDDGRCCGGITSEQQQTASAPSSATTCVESCRTFFRICLSNYQAKLVPTQALCRFGETTTPVLEDKQLRGFTGKTPQTASAGTPFTDSTISLPFDFTWPVKLLIPQYR
jgi:N terminus of Notch ligand